VEKEKARNARKIDYYKPHTGDWRGHPEDGQLAFHKDQSRVRLLLGGNQSGKTLAGSIVEAFWHALGIHPYRQIKVPNRGRIIASLGFEEGAYQNIIPKLFEWLPKGALKRQPRNNQAGIPAHWEFINGSEFNILSGVQDPKVFEGWTGDWAAVDEPCKRDIYEATRRGLLKAAGSMWFAMTPLSEPWIFNELYQPSLCGERPDIGIFTIDIRDNAMSNGGYLPDEVIDDFEKDLPEDVREARIHGKFRFLSGRVYPEYNPNVHIVPSFDVPSSWVVWDGIDPHLRKEHAYTQWAINPDKEIFVCNEIYAKLTIPQLADSILKMRKGMNVVNTLIDSSAETPDSIYRVTPRRMLEHKGIRTRLAKKYDNVYHGIHVMKDLLTPRMTSTGEERPMFFVMEHCKRHQKEFLNYVHDTRDTEYVIKDKPRKIFDDMMDLDRYFVVEGAHNNLDVKPIRNNSFKYVNTPEDDELTFDEYTY